MPKPLADYLAIPYPFAVEAEPGGRFFVSFPDLPGCMTQVERAEEIGPAANEIRILWLETAHAQGIPIPEPATPGRSDSPIVLRLPRSVRRTLAEAAEREGVSLDQYAAALLARIA